MNILEKLAMRQELTRDELASIFSSLVEGSLDPLWLSAFLMGLKCKGESSFDIEVAATTIRTHARFFPVPESIQPWLCDTCGTGGDGAHTVNISTAVAFVAAACGLYVAKHGNRSVSSRCGSADVLEALGIKLDCMPEESAKFLQDLGLCFLFAPYYHQGMKHAAPVRQALRMRTIFNILGPLLNPARPRFQIVGVYTPVLCVPLAQALHAMGVESALVVHGSGIDEIALHAPTYAAFLKDGQITELELDPRSLGIALAPLETLRGGDAAENARWLENFLQGIAPEEHQHIVALNAGALLWISGKVATWRDGFYEALRLVQSGKAYCILQEWRGRFVSA